MGTGLSHGVRVVNYSIYPVKLREHQINVGSEASSNLPCYVTTISNKRIDIFAACTESCEGQKVVVREEEDGFIVMVFNEDGGFSPKVQRSLLKYIKLNKVVNLSSKKQCGVTGYMKPYSICINRTLDEVLPTPDEKLTVTNGKLCFRGAIADVIFSERTCTCMIKDANAMRFKIIYNESSRLVILSSRGTYLDSEAEPGYKYACLDDSYLYSDVLKIEGVEVPFPTSGSLLVRGFILTTEEYPDDRQYRVGRIRDDPRWKLVLVNGSRCKLTVTLKNGKQKIVDAGVFVEYEDVLEIKTSTGISFTYATIGVGVIPIGSYVVTVTQHDHVTTKIEVGDVVGG